MVSRLAACVGAAGGKTIATMRRDGEEAILDLAAAADVHLAQALSDMSLGAARNNLRAVHNAATEVLSTAGHFGQTRLAAAAKIVTDLIDDAGKANGLRASLPLFVQSMRAIHRSDDAEKADELVANLAILASRVLSSAPSKP
jgi:hypothetical protein